MKKKLILTTLLVALFVCLFVIGVSAATMTNYCDVEITLVSGEKLTGYCEINTSNKRLLRDNIYTTTDTSSAKIDWSTIKIFDASRTTVVGGVNPTAVGGTECSKKAQNVTEYYFQPTTETILNTTFTSNWSSLQTVWIPKAVKVIDHNAFNGSAIQNVVFEEGSQLQTISQNAFANCARLKSISLPEGLTSIGYNGFYLSGLEGTVKVPNSVTTLSPGAFLSTKIETLILGDGALEIGYNFAGDFNTVNNAYLKNIYIPASTTFDLSGGTGVFFRCANRVNFYVVGTEAECSAFMTRLSQQSTASYYMQFVLAEDATEDMQAGYAVIHTEYNRCDAFYNSEHKVGESTYNFNGYTQKATYVASCQTCGNSKTTAELDPIIEIIGYSAKMGGSQLCVGYKLNQTSINAYNEAKATQINFGVVAIVPINEDELKPLYIENGEVKSIDHTISANLKNDYASVDFIIKGFSESSYNTSLVMCAYVFNGEEITYICSDSEGDTAATFKYSDKVA